jgi:hypothetical protein
MAAPSVADVAFWDAVNAYVLSCGGEPGGRPSGARMDAVVAVEKARSAPPIGCPGPEQIAPLYAPELIGLGPEHTHVCVGPLLFCFRAHRACGWRLEGAVVAALGAVVTVATWGESFRIAYEALERLASGQRATQAIARCPECGELFADFPIGAAPYEWSCGPVHLVKSADGALTQYTAGEPTETQWPAEAPA